MSELMNRLFTTKIERIFETRPGGSWCLLKVCFDGLAFLSGAWDAADMKGRVIQIQQLANHTCQIVEDIRAIGCLLYKDEQGSIFLVPDDSYQIDTISNDLQQSALHILHAFITIIIRPADPTHFFDLIGHRSPALKEDIHNLQSLWNAAPTSTTCEVCRIRPISSFPFCTVCASRQKLACTDANQLMKALEKSQWATLVIHRRFDTSFAASQMSREKMSYPALIAAIGAAHRYSLLALPLAASYDIYRVLFTPSLVLFIAPLPTIWKIAQQVAGEQVTQQWASTEGCFLSMGMVFSQGITTQSLNCLLLAGKQWIETQMRALSPSSTVAAYNLNKVSDRFLIGGGELPEEVLGMAAECPYAIFPNIMNAYQKMHLEEREEQVMILQELDGIKRRIHISQIPSSQREEASLSVVFANLFQRAFHIPVEVAAKAEVHSLFLPWIRLLFSQEFSQGELK